MLAGEMYAHTRSAPIHVQMPAVGVSETTNMTGKKRARERNELTTAQAAVSLLHTERATPPLCHSASPPRSTPPRHLADPYGPTHNPRRPVAHRHSARGKVKTRVGTGS